MTVPVPSSRPPKPSSSPQASDSQSIQNDSHPLLFVEQPRKGRNRRLACGFFLKFVCPLLALFVLCLNNFYGPDAYHIRLHVTWPSFSWWTMMKKWEAIHGPYVREYFYAEQYGKYLMPEALPFDPSQDLPNPHPPSADACAAIKELRFDCFPQGTVSQTECVNRGCCYQESTGPIPSCFYPAGYASYNYTNILFNDDNITAELTASFKSPYPKQYAKVYLSIVYLRPDVVGITYSPTKLKFEDMKRPFLRNRPPQFGANGKSLSYKVDISPDRPGFRIIRNSNGRVLFDTTTSGTLFSEQFAQLSTVLPSKYIYGLESRANSFPLDTNWNTITLFNHDIPPTKKNGYGSYPSYLCMEGDGKAHMVDFMTEVATDFRLQPNGLTVRTISGVLGLTISIGDSPEAMYKARKDVFIPPPLPPFWSLGFHFSRFGYKDTQDMKNTWTRLKNAKIPLDTLWTDIDYMNNRNDFTLSPYFEDLPQFVKELHDKEGMHYVLIIDPGVSGSEPAGTYPPYDRGLKADVFIKDSSGKKPLIGKVWNSKSTVFPDFGHPKSLEYWMNLIEDFHNQLEFDGIWLDMNEPSNFVNGSITGCPQNDLENPPYLPGVDGGALNYHTLCMSAKQFPRHHYYEHNSYALGEAVATSFALTQLRQERSFVISRAGQTFSPAFSGMWTGDVSSTWDDLKQSVRDIMTFNLLGQPMVGADICGFNGNTSKNLCLRWHQLGAFYPFSRNHNTDDAIDQDAVALGIEEPVRSALNIRYALLPYLYTLFFANQQSGLPVVRPSFYEFPELLDSYTVDQQFFWGDSILIIPALEETRSYVKAYIGDQGPWYNFTSLERLPVSGSVVVVGTPLDRIAVFLRGGYIVPTFNVNGAVTTQQLREAGSLSIIVPLNDTQQATGIFYWDDGRSVDPKFSFGHFVASKGALLSHMYSTNYKDNLRIDSVKVFSVDSPVSNVTLNSKPHPFSYDAATKILIVEPKLSVYENITLLWS
uniref:Lysosomal alpha-glucosidase n=2 Tax=Lygus hesperus TaxID=30085 RepID=A0A146LXI0_LYGHE